MKYLINNITDRMGNTRTDTEYPNRIGSVAQFVGQPMPNCCFLFRYTKHDENNNCVADHLTRTSPVKEVHKYDLQEFKGIIVHTENSIYYFSELEEKKNVVP